MKPENRIQKRIIRIITNSDYLEHTSPLFKQSKILNIDNLRKFSLAVFFCKNLNTLLPEYQLNHPYPTRNRDRPHPNHHHRTIYEKSFIFQLPIVWNELLDRCPGLITDSSSIKVFKKHLKQFLISN